MGPDGDQTSVRVAVRVRPLSAREREAFQNPCLTVAHEEPQIIIGTEKAFTFDYTFDKEVSQAVIFEAVVKSLIDGCFNGYNATILAYGQTGSGKTFTMGTGLDVSIPEEERGIVPRAADYIFQKIEEECRKAEEDGLPAPVHEIAVQFIELYQDDIFDLLDRVARHDKPGTNTKKRPLGPTIGEVKGKVVLQNVRNEVVHSGEEIMHWLKQGALVRQTGETNMNAQSSRSHAIFTIGVKHTWHCRNEETGEISAIGKHASFAFVDLAGSERLKRTGAKGTRAKEGISINSGLLALGNVISKLGDPTLKATHIPYRSSKLTRLLQDSLGGNSQTVMIACVSPAEQDFVETINTLRYANRTRNIKNQVRANEDPNADKICQLRAQLLDAQRIITEWETGKRKPGLEAVNDMFSENHQLQCEVRDLQSRLHTQEEKSKQLEAALKAEKEAHAVTRQRNAELRAHKDQLEEMNGGAGDGHHNFTDAEKLRLWYTQQLEEKDAEMARIRRDYENLQNSLATPPCSPRRAAGVLSGSQTYRVRRTTVFESNSASQSGDGDNADVPMEIPVIRTPLEIECDEGVVDVLSEQIKEKERELEVVKRAMTEQSQSYESEIKSLLDQIKQKEKEQNEVLGEFRVKGVSEEKMRERVQKFEAELKELRVQLKDKEKLLVDLRKLTQDKAILEQQAKKYEKELENLKKMKCEVMRKLEQDGIKARAKDQEHIRAVNQKDKEKRILLKKVAEQKVLIDKQQMQITQLRGSLEAQRKANRKNMSSKVAGRGKTCCDEKVLQKNWTDFMQYFHAVVFKRTRMNAYERQLQANRQELKQLHEERQRLEKNLTSAAGEQHVSSAQRGPDLPVIKQEIDDVNEAIRFVETKMAEIQNEAASCEETEEEYDHVDPYYLLSKFNDENARRFLLDKMMNHMIAQNEEILVLESKSQAKVEELAILVKERDLLRHIVKYYMVDNPSEAKLDVASVARSHLEARGCQELSADQVIKDIQSTPIASRTSSRNKARQLLHTGPQDMLGVPSLLLTSSGDSDTRSDCGSDASTSSGSQKSFIHPILPTHKTLKKQFHFTASTSGRTIESHVNLEVSGTAVPQIHLNVPTPLRPPNRSASANDVHEQTPFRSHGKVSPFGGHSMENVIPPPPPSPKPCLLSSRRYACQTNLAHAPAPATPKVPASGRNAK